MDDAADRLEISTGLCSPAPMVFAACFNRLRTRPRRLGSILGRVGPGTSDELAAWRLRDLVPANTAAGGQEALADKLREAVPVSPQPGPWCWRTLEQAGGRVEQVVVYSATTSRLDPEVKRAAEEGRIDWIT